MHCNNNKWCNFSNIGEMFIKQILVENDIPLFFICSDTNKQNYACLTINEDIGQYVVKRVKDTYIEDALNNKIDLYDLFKDDKNDYIFLTKYDFNLNVMNYKTLQAKNISDSYFPKKGTYICNFLS